MKNEIIDKIKASRSADEVMALFDEKEKLSLDDLEHISGGNVFLLGIDVNKKEDVSWICDVLTILEGKYDKKDVASILGKIFPDRFAVEDYINDGVPGVYRRLYAKVRDDFV